MDRRIFLEKLVSVFALGGMIFAAGCAREEKVPRFGNEEKLWNVASGRVKVDEPLSPAYAKDTPAFYRDASLGKVDPSFTPKVGGG